MTTFFAQPYNIDATGFYFETSYEFQEATKANRDRYGQRVEEYEIQFIDGETIDAELAKAHEINQANLGEVIAFMEVGDTTEKVAFIIAVGECGYNASCNISEIDIDVYEMDSLYELAEQFIDDGIFGDIGENLRYYLDKDAIVRNLSMDYSEIEIAGRRFVYRCG